MSDDKVVTYIIGHAADVAQELAFNLRLPENIRGNPVRSLDVAMNALHKEREALVARGFDGTGPHLMTADEHCSILWKWLSLIERRAKMENAPHSFKRIAAAGDIIRLAVTKSSYLGRRLYGGETHREVECPFHQGRWSGVPSPGNDCDHGCGLTGWLPQ